MAIHPAIVVARVGRHLVLVGCSYEVAALALEGRAPRVEMFVRPLSLWCHDARRWSRSGRRWPLVTAGGLCAWLLWHLWLEEFD